MLSAQLAMTYAPPVQAVFGTEGISVDAWLRIAAVAAATSAVVLFERWLRRRADERRTAVATPAGE
jgi:cation-transporting P-type ATPase F